MAGTPATTIVPVARPALSDAELAAVGEVFASRWLGLGRVTEEFERRLAEMLGDRHVVATNTGTTAIELGLRVAGVGPGDDVLLPSLTFVASAQAILATGARPVLCDVDPVTLNASVATFEAARTPATKAVVPVHYRGLPVELGPLLEWAAPHGIRVVEDAAHAFGSRYEDGTLVGARGDVTCFSFDPIKTITTGEGGAIVLDDPAEEGAARRVRALGITSDAWSRLEARRPWQYDVTEPGFRFHMPNLCAAIGLVQLDRLDEFVARKQAVVAHYQEHLAGHPRLRVPELPTDRVAPFLALVMTDARDEFMAHLKEHGIGSGVHYIPAHQLTLFAGCAGAELPVAERVGSQIVSLPLFNDQSDEDAERVVAAALDFG
jgi:dTDP-4-amino-4,6-dideoxygalactose transaminase